MEDNLALTTDIVLGKSRDTANSCCLVTFGELLWVLAIHQTRPQESRVKSSAGATMAGILGEVSERMDERPEQHAPLSGGMTAKNLVAVNPVAR
jgi:hypothetical protein